MLLNKWIQFGMSVAIAATSASAAVDWAVVFSPTTAASIAAALGVVKMVTNVIAPAKSEPAQPTGGSVITHN